MLYRWLVSRVGSDCFEYKQHGNINNQLCNLPSHPCHGHWCTNILTFLEMGFVVSHSDRCWKEESVNRKLFALFCRDQKKLRTELNTEDATGPTVCAMNSF